MVTERDKKIRVLCQKLGINIKDNQSITVAILKSVCKKLKNKSNNNKFKCYSKKRKEELYDLILNTGQTTVNSGPRAAPMSPMLRKIQKIQRNLNTKPTINNGPGAAPMSPMLRKIQKIQRNL